MKDYEVPQHPIRLELRGLEVFYNQSKAFETGDAQTEQTFHLRIPHLQVSGGEVVGIAGRSGEGKSTLLHVLALLLRPPVLERLEYHYVVDGQNRAFVIGEPQHTVSELALEQLRNEAFGFIFQQHFLLPYFDVRENVALPVMVRPGYRPESLEQPISELLNRLGLDQSHRRKRPSQLSGGQNQRVAVARALLHEPPFLFADEPTANLDRHKREQVLRHLRSAADLGRCVILVSHELGDLAHYCDRILMVQENRLFDPFDQNAPESARDPLPPILKSNGQSQPRCREDAGLITSHLSELIWPAGPSTSGEIPSPLAKATSTAVSPRPSSRLGFREHAWKYAWNEVFSRNQMLMRVLVALLLVAATISFSFLSDLGQGSLHYLTETTLNKPSEYLNRFVVRRKDPVNRLKSEHVRFLATKVPGLKTSPTFRQKEYRFQVYTESGLREDKYGPYSVPDQDDTLMSVKPEDRDTAQIGLIYVKGGPFLPGQIDRAGVIVSRRFLRETYWRLGDRADDVHVPDGDYPEMLEFRLPFGEGGNDEEDLAEQYLPGINGRIKVPVVGVFEYPTLVVKNTVNGEKALPQVYFPEQFLRRFGLRDGKPVWEWYYGFLITCCGEGDQPALVKPYNVLRAVSVSIVDSPRKGDWLSRELSNERSELYRALKRPFGNSLIPTCEHNKIILRFDKAREQGRQKLTDAKFRLIFDRDIRETLVKVSQGGKPCIETEMGNVATLFPESGLPSFPTDEPVYVDAILRLKTFRDVLPARRAVEAALGAELELEPKGGQVVALERFESISDFMEYGYLAMQITYVISLMFIIGITAYMHVSSKTSDIGILRSYGLSPRSIAIVYALELAMMMIPACVLGIAASAVMARFSNDWIAETVVLATGSQESSADATASLAPAVRPKVFFSLQNRPAGNLYEASKTVGLVGANLLAVTVMAVWLIKRQQIVDSLRASAG